MPSALSSVQTAVCYAEKIEPYCIMNISYTVCTLNFHLWCGVFECLSSLLLFHISMSLLDVWSGCSPQIFYASSGRHIDARWICLTLTWVRIHTNLLRPNSLTVTMRVMEQWWEESTPSSPLSARLSSLFSLLSCTRTSKNGEVIYFLAENRTDISKCTLYILIFIYIVPVTTWFNSVSCRSSSGGSEYDGSNPYP